jgi:hypothetical protein
MRFIFGLWEKCGNCLAVGLWNRNLLERSEPPAAGLAAGDGES